jgi:hypothetical protein
MRFTKIKSDWFCCFLQSDGGAQKMAEKNGLFIIKLLEAALLL